MKMDDIKQLSLDELEVRLEDAEEEFENLRIQHSTHQLDNPLRIRMVRRDIARLKTVIHEYESGVRS
ncbi:MAG: 50S ribosomal protein L29 [Calditrichaeota bacterium]|nr:50S ribosomal protein L29 [Calditrichota bacterium]